MAEQWQIRKGTTAQNNSFTGAIGELTMDTELNEVRIHDSVTLGGHTLAKKVDTANLSLSNLNSIGKNITNWSSNISNCIVEIPQNIKLELNNSTLTLKAGSKVYVPNGAGVFDEVVISADLGKTDWDGFTGQAILCINATGDYIYSCPINQTESGTSTSTMTGVYYRTNTNYLYPNNDSSIGRYSFPIAIIYRTGNTINSIDQVFNGFGYIGSTRFALPGIKWLSADRRNIDGTLKSIQRTNTNVLIETLSSGTVNNIVMVLGTGSIWTSGKYIESETEPSGNYIVWYKPSENVLRDKAEGNWNINNNIVVYGYYDAVSSQITSFRTKQSFQAVDYSEADFVIAFQRPTAQNNYTWYRLYKSGWVEQGQYGDTADKTLTFPIKMADTDYALVGVGFCIANHGRQMITSKTVNGFTTGHDANNSYTQGYMCMGMAAI